MNLCICFLLFGIFAVTNSSYLNLPYLLTVYDERHVKEAQRTDQENLKKVFVTNDTFSGDNDMPEIYSNVETFTDFIAELINILHSYNDVIFEDFVKILNKVIRKYHNNGCKYYDLKDKHEFRSLMAATLESFAELTVKEKRAELNKILLLMKLQTFNNNIKEFLDYVNSLYINNTKRRFRIILTALKGYEAGYSALNTKEDFINLVRECVKATVFYQTDLSKEVRDNLKTHMETVMNYVNFLLPRSNTDKLNKIGATAQKSDTTIVKTGNVSTEDKINKSFKAESTRTTKYIFIKEKNKRITKFRTETNETQLEDNKTLRETSKDDRNSEQKAITYANTETVIKEMFFITTEEPGVVFKSEIKSKLVEKMLGDPAGTVATAKTTTTERASSSMKHDLRRSIAPPLPGEELSIEIFDREDRRIKKKSTLRSNSINTERHELNDYNYLKKNLEKKVDRLKKINEINHTKKAKGKGDNDDRAKEDKKEKERMEEYLKKKKEKYEINDKKHRNKRKEPKNTKKRKLVNDGKSNEYDERLLRNKIKNTEDGVRKLKKTSIKKVDEHRLKRKAKSIKNKNIPAHKLRNKKKNTRNKSKKTKIYKTTCKCETNEAETTTKRNKKNAVLKSIEPLTTTKDNTTDNNEILEKTILNATNKVDNAIANVSKEVKQNRIDDTAIDSNVKVTDDNLNEETSTQSYRRVFESFPSIFKGETLNKGFFPANLWD